MPSRHQTMAGLRFDKVARRVVDRLKANLAEAVPPGTTVVVTITAPIRLASKTTAMVEAKIRGLLGQSSEARDARFVVCGSRVRVRISRNGSKRAPKLLGFVHNADIPARELLDSNR